MNNKFVLHYIGIVLAICFFCACSSNLPAKYVNVEEDSLSIYPNYKNIIIPYNIAPLNFQVENEISECVVQITSGSGNVFSVCSGREGKILFPKKTWKRLLEENKNKSILVDVYVRKGKDWFRYPTFKWDVSADPVDPYVTCRLIEPLYNAVGKISLCQFDLENGTQKTLADNKRHMEDVQHKANPVCVNCHIKQKNGSKNSLFFSRGSVGGMVLTYQGKVKLVDTKAGDMRVSAVFSSWHPNKPYIAFSNNKVMQLFMSKSDSKIEPLDFYSDLLLFDIEKNEVSYICHTPNQMETNPYWSPDGKYVYYCCSDSILDNQDVSLFRKMKYDLVRIPFNEDSLSWGSPEVVYHATKEGKSASKPKVSPDGRYVLFTLSEFSGYHYSHPDADLYLYDLQEKQCIRMDSINTNRAEGIADWSQSGRWILVSSRVDGTYTRLFLAYFDKNGVAHHRFQIPHTDPTYDKDLMKNYNAPEFGDFDVDMTPRKLCDLIDEGKIVKVGFRGEYLYDIDGTSGASVLKK